MPASKKTRIALYASALITILLILFAIFRDNTEPITLKDAKKLLESHAVSKVIVTKEYVYLQTQEHYYRIASSQVTPALFVEYKVEVGSESNALLYILLFMLLLVLPLRRFDFGKKVLVSHLQSMADPTDSKPAVRMSLQTPSNLQKVM